MNNIIMVAIALLASLVLTLIPQALAQEKIMISVSCFDCPSDEYLLKVFEPTPTDNSKLIGEKKFTREDLLSYNITGNDTIYLDKKFMGKKLDFELISLTSGLSNSQSVISLEMCKGLSFIRLEESENKKEMNNKLCIPSKRNLTA